MKIKNLKNDEKLTGWLSRIASNTCLDYLRKNKKKLNESLSEELAEKVEDIAEFDESVSEVASLEITEELLLALEPEDKLILLLKYSEHKKIKDIQQILNISGSAVKMRLKRAKEHATKVYLEFWREKALKILYLFWIVGTK